MPGQRFGGQILIDGERTSQETEGSTENHGPMRILKAFYLTLLFSLAMGLFCGELPETLRLRDDSSNDYVTDSSKSASREMEATRKERVPEQRLAIGKSAVTMIHVTNSAETAPCSGQELLQLFSIRRT